MLPEFQQFEAVVGQTVEIESETARFSARIDEVKAMTRQNDQQRQPFSIVLVTESSGPEQQQIYRLHQAELGSFELFLVPLGPRGEGMAYEAVFA
jgi:hypothetical protein